MIATLALGSVANIAALPSNVTIGASVFIATLGRCFVAVPSGSGSAVAGEYIVGTDTLASGTKAVNCLFLPYDARIWAQINTPSATPGILTIPAVSRTGTGFTVTSKNLAGATVSTDTSTFDWGWFSPSMGNGGVFGR